MSFVYSSSYQAPSSRYYTLQAAESFLKKGLSENNLILVQKAISMGVDLNSERTHFEGTPLMFACKYDCTKAIVQALLEGRASPNPVGRCSPLYYAIENPSIVSLLIKSKANVEQSSVSIKGERPLHTATKKCLEETVKLLLEADADPQARMLNGKNVQRIALESWHNTNPKNDHMLEKQARIISLISSALVQSKIREKNAMEGKRTVTLPSSHSSTESSSSSSTFSSVF